MRIIWLLSLSLWCLISQAQVSHEIKKTIGKYGTVTLSRSIYDNDDTVYYLIYQNSDYKYLADASVTALQRPQLKNLWLKLSQLIQDDAEGIVSIDTNFGLTLKKEKMYGFTGIWFWSADGRNTSILLKPAKRLKEDIYKILYDEDF